MEKDKEKMYDELREILKKNRDAEKGFAKGAENAEGAPLKKYFRKKAEDRKAYNERLLQEMRTGFPKMEVEGSFQGTVHRVWMDVKALFSGDDDESMLEEAVRGDKAAIEEYEEVIKYLGLPSGLKHLLREQLEEIRMDVRNNSTLEDLA